MTNVFDNPAGQGPLGGIDEIRRAVNLSNLTINGVITDGNFGGLISAVPEPTTIAPRSHPTPRPDPGPGGRLRAPRPRADVAAGRRITTDSQGPRANPGGGAARGAASIDRGDA